MQDDILLSGKQNWNQPCCGSIQLSLVNFDRLLLS